jgi:hypothetical protein
MNLKTYTFVTPRNNEKVRVWKEASRNRTIQKIFCFRLCDTMGRLKSRTSPNIIIQIRSINGYRPEGRFSSTYVKRNNITRNLYFIIPGPIIKQK